MSRAIMEHTNSVTTVQLQERQHTQFAWNDRKEQAQGMNATADEMPHAFTAVVIEDHDYTRESLQHTINDTEHFVCTRAYSDCATALHELARGTRPDIVVLDLNLSGILSGIPAIDTIHEIAPATSILVHSAYYREDIVTQVISRGVRGFLCKPFDLESLEHALHTIMAGLSVFSLQVEKYFHAAMRTLQGNDTLNRFTPVQRNVIRLLLQDLQNKEIAAELSTSPFTVQHHLTHIYKILGVNNRNGAIRLLQEVKHRL